MSEFKKVLEQGIPKELRNALDEYINRPQEELEETIPAPVESTDSLVWKWKEI